jgi:hypothetical protein
MNGKQSFSGRKLLQHIPFGQSFNGTGIGHGVTRCPAMPAWKRLGPEKMKTKPATTYGPRQLAAYHDLLIEVIFSKRDAECRYLLERFLPEPYPNRCVRPHMAFVPTEIKFTVKLPQHRAKVQPILVASGKHIGKEFVPVRGMRSGVLFWLLEDETPKTRTQNKSLMLETIGRDGALRCASCGLQPIADDCFILCWTCDHRDMVNAGNAKTHFDFSANKNTRKTPRRKAMTPKQAGSKNRKDQGFQDDEESLPVYTSPSATKLSEVEFACILAEKYPGFTAKDSPAYRKAQRAAAQLSARFIFKRPASEVAAIVGGNTKAVTKFCRRAREEYADHLAHQPLPEEVRVCMASGMLRELFPPNETQGCLVRSSSSGEYTEAA